MSTEHERRFRLSESSERFRERIGGDWVLRHVLGVTFGLSDVQSMDNDGWVVRVRAEGPIGDGADRRRLEYKARLGGSSWTEFGITVTDSLFDCAKLLMAIGLRPGLVIDRVRATAERGVTVAVDEVRWLGTFVELEGPPDRVSAFAADVGLRETAEAGAYGDLIRDLLAHPDINREHEQALRHLIYERS